VYNKYIGNTGKYIRVEDHPRVNAQNAGRPAAKPPLSLHQAPQEPIPQHIPEKHAATTQQTKGIKNKSLFGGLGGGLGNLLGGFSGGFGGLSNSFRGMFDHLPFGLDFGDILLFLLLLFFFIESGDEEFIIILAVIAYNLFKER
jgi:hypothetical protein